MPNLFSPTWYFDDIYKIPAGFFQKKKIRYLLCDIDNTLVTYDDREPTPEVLSFFDRLSDEQVSLVLISNNCRERVELFAKNTGLPYVFKAGKPMKKGAELALEKISAVKEHTALLGDQILTDALLANRIGVRMLLVKPIKDKKTLFFRMKRAMEKPILRSFLKSHSLNDENADLQNKKGMPQ